MADYTLGDVLDLVNIHSGDTNPNNPGVDAVTKRKLINQWAQFLHSQFSLQRGGNILASIAGGALSGVATTTSASLLVARVLDNVTGAELELKSMSEIIDKQRLQPNQGYPVRAGVELQNNSTLIWVVRVHPVPLNLFAAELVMLLPFTRLATDGTADANTMKITMPEADAVSRYAASDVARICARDPSYIQGIVAPIDQYLQSFVKRQQAFFRPMATEEQVSP